MPNAPLRLAALVAADLPKPGAKDWDRQMRAVITRGHTAAWLAGTAERLKVPLDSPLLSRARLSRAERAEISKLVDRQLKYLKDFEQARGDMSERAIAARADMYPGAVRATYYGARWGDWEIPDSIMPGNQECLTRCLCRISEVRDNNDGTGTLVREMGETEHHCDECSGLAGEHEVQRREAA